MRMNRFVALCLAVFLAAGSLPFVKAIAEEPLYPIGALNGIVILNEKIESIEEGAFEDSAISGVAVYNKNAVIGENAFPGGDTEIICFSGSTAEAYAKQHGNPIVYLDKCEVVSNTVNNGCAKLPITWTVKGTPSESEIADNKYVFSVYKDGECIAVSEETTEEAFVYTPAEGGEYMVQVKASNQFESFLAWSEVVPVADKLYLGTFEQDTDSSTADKVEWRVLYANEEKALLLSEYILHTDSYFDPYWIKYKYCYWSGSIIGTVSTNYLGNVNGTKVKITPTTIPMKDGSYGTDDDLYTVHARYWCENVFYASAFSEDEKARILLTENVNEDSPYGVDGGPNTFDHVFFLSYSEVRQHLPNKEDRKAKNTPVAQKILGNKSTYWWLRTNGEYRCNAMYVYASSGSILTSGSDVGHADLGYRPAVWIRVGG